MSIYKSASVTSLGLGLGLGAIAGVGSYLLSGLADRKDKYKLARILGSICLGAGVGAGVYAGYDKVRDLITDAYLSFKNRNNTDEDRRIRESAELLSKARKESAEARAAGNYDKARDVELAVIKKLPIYDEDTPTERRAQMESKMDTMPFRKSVGMPKDRRVGRTIAYNTNLSAEENRQRYDAYEKWVNQNRLAVKRKLMQKYPGLVEAVYDAAGGYSDDRPPAIFIKSDKTLDFEVTEVPQHKKVYFGSGEIKPSENADGITTGWPEGLSGVIDERTEYPISMFRHELGSHGEGYPYILNRKDFEQAQRDLNYTAKKLGVNLTGVYGYSDFDEIIRMNRNFQHQALTEGKGPTGHMTSLSDLRSRLGGWLQNPEISEELNFKSEGITTLDLLKGLEKYQKDVSTGKEPVDPRVENTKNFLDEMLRISDKKKSGSTAIG